MFVDKRNILNEVNEKIARIKKDIAIKMDCLEKDDEIIKVHTDFWQNGNNVAEGIKFKAIDDLISDSKSNAISIYSPPKSIIPPHSHEQKELCVCLSGKLKIVLNDEEHILSPIESLYIEPNVIHGVEFLEESQLFVVWFSKFEI